MGPHKKNSRSTTGMRIHRTYIGASEHLWSGYFVRRSQGNTATSARATAAGVDVLRSRTGGLYQLPVVEHVQVRVEHELKGQEHSRSHFDLLNRRLIRDEPGQQCCKLPGSTRTYKI